MKLRITHFHDPYPRKDGYYNQEEFENAKEAWKARQVKPTFDWGKKGGFNKETVEAKKALQHYEENRMRYEGFELEDYYFYNQEIDVTIQFHNDGTFYLMTLGEKASYSGEISVSLFEQICKENGIQLNKIETK